MDYRPIPEAHRETYRRMLRYAFVPERGPDFDDDPPEHPEEYHPRGVYETADDDTAMDPANLRAVCAFYDFTANVRGDWHSVGGVSAVASPPENRRTGHVTEMLDALHEELRANDTAFAVLWPFNYEFYRRFGYAMCNTYQRTTVPPGELDGVVPEPAGTFRRFDPDDFDRLDGIYRTWASETLGLRRTEGWWRYRVFSSWYSERYVYGWEDDEGTLRGYVVYSMEGGDTPEDRTMDVQELAYADPEARRQLYRFCRNHDSQVSTVKLFGPPDSTLLETLTDPRAATVTQKPGPMVRIVDLTAAVSALSVAADVSGSATVAVEDDHHDWNDGTFELSFANGAATCRETEADPDLTAGIGPLSLVLVGARSVSTLREQDRIDVHEGGTQGVETLAAACPPTPTYLREGF